MEGSIWASELAAFRDKLADTDPMPAGVSASAVAASLGLSLLMKVLRITAKRKGFAGDPDRLGALLEAAQGEADRLAQAADRDIAAFDCFMECSRLPQSTGERREAADRDIIAIPMSAARAAIAGLDLCAEAVETMPAALAADLGVAASLLCGAARAILLCVESNALRLVSGEHRSSEPAEERRRLENRAIEQAEAVRQQVLRILRR